MANNIMSTRCQIGILKEGTKDYKKPEILIYRHSDGYPEDESGVKATMQEFFPRFLAARGGDDTEYMGAQLLAHMIGASQNWASTLPEQSRETWHFLGYGICGDHIFHGDIEFYYSISPIVAENDKEKHFGRSTRVKVEVYEVTRDWEKKNPKSEFKLVDTWTFEAKEKE